MKEKSLEIFGVNNKAYLSLISAVQRTLIRRIPTTKKVNEPCDNWA